MKHEAAACCCIEKITAASGRTAAARPKSKTSKKGQYKSGFEKLPQVMRHSLRLIWMAEHIHGSDFGGGLRILPLANICKEDRVSRRPHSATDWSWLAHYVLNYAIGSSANFCNFFSVGSWRICAKNPWLIEECIADGGSVTHPPLHVCNGHFENLYLRSTLLLLEKDSETISIHITTLIFYSNTISNP